MSAASGRRVGVILDPSRKALILSVAARAQVKRKPAPGQAHIVPKASIALKSGGNAAK